MFEADAGIQFEHRPDLERVEGVDRLILGLAARAGGDGIVDRAGIDAAGLEMLSSGSRTGAPAALRGSEAVSIE